MVCSVLWRVRYKYAHLWYKKKQISQQRNVLLPPSVEVSSTTWRRNGKNTKKIYCHFAHQLTQSIHSEFLTFWCDRRTKWIAEKLELLSLYMNVHFCVTWIHITYVVCTVVLQRGCLHLLDVGYVLSYCRLYVLVSFYERSDHHHGHPWLPVSERIVIRITVHLRHPAPTKTVVFFIWRFTCSCW